MAQGIKRYVDVEITKETALVTAAGFGVPVLLTDDVAVITTGTRLKEYLSLAAVELDFVSTTDEYKAAKAYFTQDPFNKNQPEKLLIGVWDRVGVEPIEDALTAIRNVNDDWYAMGITASIRTFDADLEILADNIEALRKVLILDSNDADNLDIAITTDLLSVLNAKGTSGYKRTMINYHDDATKYTSWAMMGKFLPLSPGKSQMAYQILADASAGADFIDAADITEVQKDNLLAKYGNAMMLQAGQTFFFDGTMVGGKNIDREGEWFDIIRSIDFLQARTEEGLLALLLEKANAGAKIPYTDAGISMVENRLSSLLEEFGVTQGILVDGSIEITVPTRASVSQANRDDRILPDVDFTAELAGAIQTIIVRGKVRV